MSLHPASLVAVVALGWCGASALVAVAWSTTARHIKGRPLLNETTEDVDLLALARAVGVLREPGRHPESEFCVGSIHPSHRREFDDDNLANLITEWSQS